MENQKIENNNKEIKKEGNNNEDNKNLKNNDNNNSTVKEVNNINKEKSENNKYDIERPKIKIDDLINKDKKFKEIYILINSSFNLNQFFKASISKDKINNFLSGGFSKRFRKTKKKYELISNNLFKLKNLFNFKP